MMIEWNKKKHTHYKETEWKRTPSEVKSEQNRTKQKKTENKTQNRTENNRSEENTRPNLQTLCYSIATKWNLNEMKWNKKHTKAKHSTRLLHTHWNRCSDFHKKLPNSVYFGSQSQAKIRNIIRSHLGVSLANHINVKNISTFNQRATIKFMCFACFFLLNLCNYFIDQ